MTGWLDFGYHLVPNRLILEVHDRMLGPTGAVADLTGVVLKAHFSFPSVDHTVAT